MTYNPDIHHRHSIRLNEYDYSSEGLYFITICTQGKRCIFGKVIDESIRLNKMGQMVEKELLKTQQIRPNMMMHEYIIMPNHIHFIIEITQRRGGLNPPDCTGNTNTIGSMVRGFKSSITKQLGRSIFQRNYYEHIIRNARSYEEISDYIINNPSRWVNDELFVEP